MNDSDDSSHSDDVVRAQELARRYRCEFVDLRNFRLNLDILKRVPAELMFRYNFLPLEEMHDGRLAVAIVDPSQLMLLDEISLLLGKRLIFRVATLGRIIEILHGIDPIDRPPRAPDAPVGAPKKPKPRLRSGGAKATPDDETYSSRLGNQAEHSATTRPVEYAAKVAT